MHKKSQKFRAFPVFSVIKQRDFQFDNIAEIIDHIPIATVQIIELVTPLGSQLYCLYKSLIKYSPANVYDQFVAHNFTKDFGRKYGLKIGTFSVAPFNFVAPPFFIRIVQRPFQVCFNISFPIFGTKTFSYLIINNIYR